jgi:hypothetical protein
VLSDADKQRIEEEECYRAEVRAQQGAKANVKRKGGCLKILGIIVGIVILYVVAVNVLTPSGVGREKILAMEAAPCGETEADAREALEIIIARDAARATALYGRGGYFMVDRGTRVRVKSFNGSGSYSEVYVIDGAHSGRTCYVATGALR